jgi:hypothetical protein
LWFQSPNPCCCRFRWACGKRRAWSQSKWHSRNDVVDHQTDVRGEDGINHQLNDPLFHLERQSLDSVTDAGAEALQPFRQAKFLLPIAALALDLTQPLTQRPTMLATPDYARRCLWPTLDDVNLEGRQSKLGCRFARLTPCGLAVDSLPTHSHSGGSSIPIMSPRLFGSCGGMTARAHPSRLSSVSRWGRNSGALRLGSSSAWRSNAPPSPDVLRL